MARDAYRGGWAPTCASRPGRGRRCSAALKERGLRTGLLSNTHWPRDWHEDALAADGLLELLDARVYTSEIPHLKPHPEAFAAVMDAVGTTAERACSSATGSYDDISGAKALGMRAVWIRNDKVPAYVVEPDAAIEELDELLDVIDAWR